MDMEKKRKKLRNRVRNEAPRFEEEVRFKSSWQRFSRWRIHFIHSRREEFFEFYRSRNWDEWVRGGTGSIKKEKKYIYIYFWDKCFGFRKWDGFFLLGGPSIGIKFHNTVGRESWERGNGFDEWRAKDTRERERGIQRLRHPRGGTDERTQQGIPSCLRSDTPGLPTKEEKRVPPRIGQK